MSYSIIVIGAGAGGLVIAIGAARAGKKVLLIERGHWGGDCTNFGCIPSKALIASAHSAHAVHAGKKLGLEGGAPFTHAEKALERVRDLISEVRGHEDPAALKEKGVETLTGVAQFIDRYRLKVVDDQGKERVVTGKQIVIGTGGSPLIPQIEGIEGTPYLTNETLFDLKEIPKRLCIVGGGPIGCELAQAFSRLGSQVTQVHRRTYLLKKEEPDAQKVIAETFRQEGIDLYLGYSPKRVNYANGEFTIEIEGEEKTVILSDALLLAAGRKPNLDSLNLEAAGVNFSKGGIEVNRFGQTNQKHIWAVGDVTGGPQFTHAAENQARTVLASLLLPFRKKMDHKQPVPRVTFTDPEVASFGLLEKEGEEAYGKENVKTYHVPFTENDRAMTAGRREGFVKVVTKKSSSKILGATIVGPRAGEMLPELSLAKRENIPLRKLARIIHPYPTYNLAIRRAADQWLTEVFLPKLRHPLQSINWKRFLPLLIILILMGATYFSGVYKYFTFETLQQQHQVLKAFVGAHPITTPILFMLLYGVSTSLSLPGGAILSLIGGFLFPIPWSTLYVLIGATIGASVIFLVAKTAFGDFFRRKAGPFLKKMERGFEKNAWSYLLFLRFVPLFPFWLVNIAPAFFKVSLLTFAWTTFVGIIPGAYVFTQTGAGLSAIFEAGETFSIGSIFNIQLRIALIALGIFSLLPILIKRLVRKGPKRN